MFLPRKRGRMKRILFVILAVILILSIYVSGCGINMETVLAPIEDLHIWADNSSPEQYFVDVASGEPDSCYEYSGYDVTRYENKVRVEILNIHYIRDGCAEIYSIVEHTIPIGSDYLPGVNYTVEVNDVAETFIPPIL